jgi:pyridoxal phosphate enzyme (YggS family)
VSAEAGTPAAGDEDGRLAELAANLAAVRARIAAACETAGRPPDDVTLIAVTKTFPASDVLLLSRLGVVDIGENKDQEAAPKAAACASAGLALRWHFIGQLQANKAASVVGYAYMVHSVDRIRLVEALGRRARLAGRLVRCLVQVSLDEPGGSAARQAGAAERGGAEPAEVSRIAAAIAAEDGLALAGVMAVAPLGQPARPAYGRLRDIAEQVRSAHPDARVISAGMTGDLDDAIAKGATHVRVGTALLGGRRPFVR